MWLISTMKSVSIFFLFQLIDFYGQGKCLTVFTNSKPVLETRIKQESWLVRNQINCIISNILFVP